MHEELPEYIAQLNRKSKKDGWFLDKMCPYKYIEWTKKMSYERYRRHWLAPVKGPVEDFQLSLATVSNDILQRVPGLYDGRIYPTHVLDELIGDICSHQKLYTLNRYREEYRNSKKRYDQLESEEPILYKIRPRENLSYERQVEGIKEDIEFILGKLESCTYSHARFLQYLQWIQRSVDSLCRIGDPGLDERVVEINARIERTLAVRLQAGIEAWTKALKGPRLDDGKEKLGGEPKITKSCIEIRCTNKVVHVCPSIEETRDNLMQQLLSWQNIILTSNRIDGTPPAPPICVNRTHTAPFENILNMMPGGHQILETAYKSIEDQIIQMQDYVQQWLAYQSLWELQPDMLIEGLGEGVSLWVNKLIEIKNSRAAFDTSDTGERIGPIINDHARVETKVTLRHDCWHKNEVMSKFSTLLNNEMTKLHGEITKAKNDLELQSIESADTRDAVSFLTYVQSLKAKSKQWESEKEVFRLGQQSLERQGFKFPPSWLYIDNLEAEWSAFSKFCNSNGNLLRNRMP